MQVCVCIDTRERGNYEKFEKERYYTYIYTYTRIYTAREK